MHLRISTHCAPFREECKSALNSGAAVRFFPRTPPPAYQSKGVWVFICHCCIPLPSSQHLEGERGCFCWLPADRRIGPRRPPAIGQHHHQLTGRHAPWGAPLRHPARGTTSFPGDRPIGAVETESAQRRVCKIKYICKNYNQLEFRIE